MLWKVLQISEIFKTLSAAYVLILELAAVCYFCVSGLIHFRQRVMRFTANEVTWYKFPPLSFLLLLGTSCLGRPSGRRPSVTLRVTCRAPARIWLVVIDFQKSIWAR